jgi:3-oxoacyl-(acyl-carrier-protein) synthase
VTIDAVVVGCTTGGMPESEALLRSGDTNPERYRWHGTGTVARFLASSLGCTGPAITVSTACSSGAVALKAALELIRRGLATTVLAGGADAICRLTYHGFGMLQLVDPAGTRPLDRARNGMTLGEGAAFLLLEGAQAAPEGAVAELAGAGLSCDAHHPSAPHPEGVGAAAAMRAALEDAGIAPFDVDYVNLHGTGTKDNDLVEARAIRAVFGPAPPPVSSVKGALGHSLAAAGAVEAAVCVLAIEHGIIPANTGFEEPDPAIDLVPEATVRPATLSAVLSNSFGFGGNNAAVVLARPGRIRDARCASSVPPLSVLAAACVTGAGDTAQTLQRLRDGLPAAGRLPEEKLAPALPPRVLRRLRRLPRMVLGLAEDACKTAGWRDVSGIFLGTGWGPLSETHEFLDRLFASGEEFSSPTEFVGSVHNALAAQAAIWLKAPGANITATAGDSSFEQAALLAAMLADGGKGSLLLGADEAHLRLTAVFDRSAPAAPPADGGAALAIVPGLVPERRASLRVLSLGETAGPREDAARLAQALGRIEGACAGFGLVLAGIPAAEEGLARAQLAAFLDGAGFRGPVVDYRAWTGQFSTAGAVAAAVAVGWLKDGLVPGAVLAGEDLRLCGRSVLLLSLGSGPAALLVGT